MQNRKLIADWCYEKGLADNVIEKKVRDGKTFFVVNDYEALRGLFGELLAEVQRIKSEGDYEAGKALVETYAVNIDPELHKEVLERYASLGLKPYGGFVNPDIITTGIPHPQASQLKPELNPIKKDASFKIFIRSCRGLSPVKSSAPKGIRT